MMYCLRNAILYKMSSTLMFVVGGARTRCCARFVEAQERQPTRDFDIDVEVGFVDVSFQLEQIIGFFH